MIGSEARVYYVHRAKEASGGRETARHEKQRERTACSGEGPRGVGRGGGGGRRAAGRAAGQRRTIAAYAVDDRGRREFVGNSNERTRGRGREKDAREKRAGMRETRQPRRGGGRVGCASRIDRGTSAGEKRERPIHAPS